MANSEKHGMFRIVGVRSNGERVAISAHRSREVAESVVGLIQDFSGYSDVRIEHDGKSDATVATNGE